MTLHNVDGARFDYLVRVSFTPSQLREFFDKQRRALIVAHERVQNLPSDLIAAVRRFSPQAHSVMRFWLASQVFKDPVADDQLVPRFRAVEELGVEFGTAEATHLAASALRALYREQPPAPLLEFLRTPIRGRGLAQHEDTKPAAGVIQQDWEALLEACAGATPSQEIGNPTLREAVTLILAALSGDAAALPADMVAPRAALEAHLSKRRRQIPVAEPVRGIVSNPLPIRVFDPSLDYSSFEVVATRTRSTFKQDVPWFCEADAFIRGNEIFTMSEGDLRRALPSTGEIVIHRNRGISEPPLNESRVFEFEFADTTFPSKAIATALVDRLLPVVFVPCPSADAHGIRDFVADYAKHALNDSAIFVTTDHLCLRLRKVSLAAVHLSTNEWMMECWPNLTAYELSSGTFVVAPLPVSSQFLDCGPLATVAKRMLSQLRTRSELALPKAAISAIAEQLSNDEAASSEMTRQRLLRNLQSIESSGNEYQQLVNALLSVPQIAKDIADRTQKAVQERLSLMASEKQKIDNLRRQASELEASNKKLEEERANAVKELRIAIKKAFASATKKEIAALGDISLLTALLPGAQVPAEASSTSETLGYTATSPSIPTIAVQFAEKSESTVEQTLEAFGVDPKHILVASQVFSSISRSGVLVILEEVTEVGVQLACSLARTGVRVLDVPIGLVQSSINLSWLTGNDVDVLLLQNANLSDLSVYGSNLISHVARRLAGRTKAHLPAIILNGCSGPAAVPWPGELESLSIRITLASLEQAAAMGRQEQELDRSRTPLQRLLDRALERQADKMELTNDVRDALRHLTLGVAVTRS